MENHLLKLKVAARIVPITLKPADQRLVLYYNKYTAVCRISQLFHPLTRRVGTKGKAGTGSVPVFLIKCLMSSELATFGGGCIWCSAAPPQTLNTTPYGWKE